MNWDMLGHEWAVSLLKEHLAQNRLRQAYLITGPPGIGRRTLALRLAQALNCPQPLAAGEPCRTCRTCKQIERMQHPDLAVVQAEQRGGTLKVDQIRDLQHSLSLAPYEARYRIGLFLRFEEAHPSASNALLKTLEEPPPQVVMILTAQNAESLLPTIVSRCEVLRLRPLPAEQVRLGLQERWNLPAEQAQLLGPISGGRPGYAMHLHQEPESMEQRQAWLDDMRRLVGCSRVERFAYAEAITKWKDKDQDKEKLRETLLVWISFWRDIFLRAADSAASIANLDRSEPIDDLAARCGLEAARSTLSALERTLNLLDGNINPRLAVEVLMLDLPYC